MNTKLSSKMIKIGLLAAVPLSFACRAHQEHAPYGATVSVPEDLMISWSLDNNDFDFRGLILPFDIGVFASDNDNDTRPLPYTRVEITSSYSGVYLMPQGAVDVVSYPSLPAGIASEADVEAACSDENGDYAMNEEWCAWYWDTQTSQFFQFTGTYADNYQEDTAGNSYFFAPTHMVTETNAYGLVKAWVLVDSLPVTSTGDDDSLSQANVLDVGITASVGWDSATFKITVDDK